MNYFRKSINRSPTFEDRIMLPKTFDRFDLSPGRKIYVNIVSSDTLKVRAGQESKFNYWNSKNFLKKLIGEIVKQV